MAHPPERRRIAPRSVVSSIALTIAAVLLGGCAGDDDAGSAPVSGVPANATPVTTAPAAGTAPSSPPATNPPTTSQSSTTGPSATASQGPSATPTADLESAAGLAVELSRVEGAVRSTPSGTASAEQAGRDQQRIYRVLADHPEWDDAVIAGAAPGVRDAIRLNIEARRAVADHSAGRPRTEPPTTLPAWTIAAPLPVPDLLALYHEAERRTGVPWSYLAAIHFVETRFGRIVGASPDGARGPMQFLPETWATCCTGDIDDPHDAIIGAAEYLRSNGAPDDMVGALYAYNPNDGYVGAVDAYARNLAADERALSGYHGWEVYVSTSAGTIRLPVGYAATDPVDALTYLVAHPDDGPPRS